jgi:hypothetical protein
MKYDPRSRHTLKSFSSRFIAGTLISPTRPSNISSLPSHDSVAACVTPSIEYNQNSFAFSAISIPTMTPNTAHQKKSTQSPLRDDRKANGSSFTVERTVDLTDVLLFLHPSSSTLPSWPGVLASLLPQPPVSSLILRRQPTRLSRWLRTGQFPFANPSSGVLIPYRLSSTVFASH